MTTTGIPTACLAGLLLAAAPSPADEPLEPTGLQPLQPLDARVEDVSVLSASLRVESPGLAVPSGFDEVYRVPGEPGKLMRVNGALFAVFDRSVYGSWQGRAVAEVPPSTVFHIGPPLPEPGGLDRVAAVGGGSERGAGYGVVPPAAPGSGRPTGLASAASRPVLPRFVSDETYRARRLAELVNRRLTLRSEGSTPPDRSP